MSIPNGSLREYALEKLTAERLNSEAAALFACLAPRRARARLVGLIVSYQLLYDYLDAVNEQPGSQRLVNGLRLHAALTDVLASGKPMQDLYGLNPQRDDGGYTHALGVSVASTLATLPASGGDIALVLTRSAERCRQAQARNHAIPAEGARALQSWCAGQSFDISYLWWETAAAGISCLGIYALLAVAAEARSTAVDAKATDAAYFPGVCALSALLDSLVDHHSDRGTSNHSFTAHYSGSAEAAERLTTIARDTERHLRRLRCGPRHAFILTGIFAFYLSAPTLHPSFARPVAETVIQTSTPAAHAMRIAMRARRRIAARRCSTR